MRTLYILVLVVSAGFISCTEIRNTSGGDSSGGGAIVLGDSSTIVTETDSQYLKDMVLDYEPVKAPEPLADTIAIDKPADTVQVAKAEDEPASKTAPAEDDPTEAPTGKGLKIAFKEVTLFIPGIEAKGSGTTYQLRNGNINGKDIRISGGKVQKISQRYQTVVVAKNNLGTLVLDNLGTTTGWEALRGTSTSYTISGLAGKLAAPRVSPSAIRNAVTRAAKKKRINKKTEQKWLAAVKNTRAANQKPLSVKLRSVMWKIDGKDNKGKPFSKQVRLDMPI